MQVKNECFGSQEKTEKKKSLHVRAARNEVLSFQVVLLTYITTNETNNQI